MAVLLVVAVAAATRGRAVARRVAVRHGVERRAPERPPRRHRHAARRSPALLRLSAADEPDDRRVRGARNALHARVRAVELDEALDGVARHGPLADGASDALRGGAPAGHRGHDRRAPARGGLSDGAPLGNPWVTPEYGFDQGVDDYFSAYDERFGACRCSCRRSAACRRERGRIRLYNRVKYLVLGELSTTARDTILVDEALRWLAAPAPQPFFLYVHMMSPHHPYDPPPPFDRFVPDRRHAPVTNYPRKSYRFFEGGEPLDAAALAT
jgi:hypothetical protein